MKALLLVRILEGCPGEAMPLPAWHCKHAGPSRGRCWKPYLTSDRGLVLILTTMVCQRAAVHEGKSLV